MVKIVSALAGFVLGSALAVFLLVPAAGAPPAGDLVKGRTVSHDERTKTVTAVLMTPLPGVERMRVSYDESTIWEESHMLGQTLFEGATWHASSADALMPGDAINVILAGSDRLTAERIQINKEPDAL